MRNTPGAAASEWTNAAPHLRATSRVYPDPRVATPRSVSAPQLGQASAAAPVAGLSLSQGPLVIEAIQTLDSGQQVEDSRQAKLASPLEVRLREESQTKFQGLGPEAAAKLAGETFPELVEHPAGGPPPLPAGESITSYPSDYAARVSGAGDGGRAVIDSLAPIALETSPGTREPIDLSPAAKAANLRRRSPRAPCGSASTSAKAPRSQRSESP